MIRLTTILMAMVFSFAAMAGVENGPEKGNASDAKVAVMKGRKLMKLVYVNDHQSKVKIAIINERGKRINSKTLRNTSGFILPFNFSELNNGKYIIEITDDEGTIIQEIDYTWMPPKKSELKTSIYEIGDSERYNLAVVSENDKPLTVEILNNQQDLIFKERIKDYNAFSRIYNVSKAWNGPFTFRVSNGEMSKYIPLKD